MANKYTYSKLADSYDAGIEQAINMLAGAPKIGRACDEIKAGYRRLSTNITPFFTVRDKLIF